MKKPYEVTHCEYCDSLIVVQSPPKKEYHERGMIVIEEGTILLSDDLVKAKKKRGMTASHAVCIDGYYCDHRCLLAKIREILDIKE